MIFKLGDNYELMFGFQQQPQVGLVAQLGCMLWVAIYNNGNGMAKVITFGFDRNNKPFFEYKKRIRKLIKKSI